MANFLMRLVDPLGDDRENIPPAYRFSGDWRAWGVPAGLGIALLLISVIGLFQDHYQFWFAYLVGWLFCLSIGLGSLLFVMFQHITKAKWVVAVRRFPEMIMTNFWVLAILAIPLLTLGLHDVYHWSHAELYDPADSHFDGIVAGKAGYFFWPGEHGGTPWFFYIRTVFYFFVWILVSTKLFKGSVRQDTDPQGDTNAGLRKTSAWGIPLVGVTTAFAGFDFSMTLDPHWYSTIFGVYFFAGGFVGALALMTLMAVTYHRKGMLLGEATFEHFQDFGKYLFAFTVFWMYIFFSQWMLIWYANIPEETIWMEQRMMHGWANVTLFLVLFHFAVPFFILITRTVKRSAVLLSIMCVWMLIMHFVDLFWQIKPNLALATGNPEYAAAAISWMDISLFLGFAGLFVGVTIWRASRHATAPFRDVHFPQSTHFQNM